MANAGNSTASWRGEAYTLYTGAVRQLRSDLYDPVRSKLDHTLAAVMLMGTFEVQTYHQLQLAIPYSLKCWSHWAETIQSEEEFAANRFSEINERLANARAEIKQQRISSPSVIASRLLKFDDEIEAWRRDLPASWAYKSYCSVRSTRSPPSEVFESHYDKYPDLWIASTWNNYRSVRLLIHEAIIAATLKHGSEEEIANLTASMAVLARMARDICNSVAYIMGRGREGSRSPTPEDGNGSASPGGYLLLWPLFLAGMLRTTRRVQRAWITSEIRHIGTTMGIHLAISMARVLVEHNKSFSDAEVWFIGQFYP
ncbi:hypothetical protein PLIIFM63780_000178 [Purpureocillium lilacinum]|nr:hypothetical protein PLIIFM63780_000178 [Purpureocillium lilacinum]